jgi:hypothetical protein
MTRCALVAVAGGAVYHEYALALMESAREHFKPCDKMEYLILEGEEGWPAGTITRYRTLLDSLPQTHYVYLADADMLVSAAVGDEILPGSYGITATLHPGYVGKPPSELPFEDRPDYAAYVPPYKRLAYHCGAFVGGERMAVRILATHIENLREEDEAAGRISRWHDESYLNYVLAWTPPVKVLSPSYCFPDRADWYRSTVWQEDYPRIITALDKPAEHRGER